MQYRYIANGMAASKDLKVTAHRVRMEIDHRPVTKDPDGKVNNPRKRRLVSVLRKDLYGQGFRIGNVQEVKIAITEETR